MRHTILLLSFFCCTLSSTEVDSFTLRDPLLRDALSEMDAMMQRYIDKALVASEQTNSCDSKKFEESLHDLLGGLAWSKIEDEIQSSLIIDKRILPREESIYRDIGVFQGVALFMANLGYILKIGDFYIGSDKFGHFIDQGFDYYSEESLERGMQFGEMTERTYFGLMTTAVYSYGDLSANLDGYRFWTNVTQGDNPYFTCQAGVWTQQRTFTWTDYLNAAWDEGLNCSFYKTEEITDAVYARIEELGMTCPVDKKYCPEMKQHYGLLAPRVISQACFY